MSPQEEDQQEAARVDLTRPLCSDYAALGYKCVQFWECGEDGNILDRWLLLLYSDSILTTFCSPDLFTGEGMLDARFNNKRSRQDPGAFDPYSKQCGEDFQVIIHLLLLSVICYDYSLIMYNI